MTTTRKEYRLRGYHSQSHKKWRSDFDKVGNYVGIELEMEANEYVSDVLETMPFPASHLRPDIEEDGSLSDEGLEVIFPPFSIATLKRKDSTFGKIVNHLSKTAYTNGDTGMHYNVNTTGWSFQRVSVFTGVVHYLSEEVIKNLGGRRPNGYAQRVIWRRASEYSENGGYYVARRRRNRVELRFPTATTDHNQIVKMLSFIEMLIAFSAEATKDDMIEVMREFVAFMCKTKKRRHMLTVMLKGDDAAGTLSAFEVKEKATAALVKWWPVGVIYALDEDDEEEDDEYSIWDDGYNEDDEDDEDEGDEFWEASGCDCAECEERRANEGVPVPSTVDASIPVPEMYMPPSRWVRESINTSIRAGYHYTGEQWCSVYQAMTRDQINSFFASIPEGSFFRMVRTHATINDRTHTLSDLNMLINSPGVRFTILEAADFMKVLLMEPSINER